MVKADWSNKTSSATVHTGTGDVISVVLTSGSDAATAIVYDNTSATGTIVCKLAANAANTTAVWQPGAALPVGTGIHVALTGTAPSCTVAYLQ